MTTPTSWPSPSGTAITAIPIPPSARVHTSKLKYLGYVGAGVAALGCLLPWANVNAGFFSISVNGTSTDDGKIAIALAVGAAILMLCKVTITDWIAAVVFLGMFALAAVEVVRFTKTTELAIMQPGIGIYLFGLGAGAGLVGALIATRQRRI